jgi:hypothetical protein
MILCIVAGYCIAATLFYSYLAKTAEPEPMPVVSTLTGAAEHEWQRQTDGGQQKAA